MTLVRLGALRFHGLIADFGTLPIDATLIGAIFDATDTVQKFVFDGSAWVEFVSGTGEDNTGANVGVGTGNVFRDKTGVTLNFKTLIGGTNIVVTDNADDITLSSTGTSPLTTKGDLFGFSTVDDRFPVGVDGQVIQADSSQGVGLKYIDLLFTKGQLLTFDTGLTQLGVGTNDQVLTADSAIASGLKWADATGGGGITGLNPNSTILEYLNSVPDVFTDYTTPTSATATSPEALLGETGGATATQAGLQGNVFVQALTGLNVGDSFDTVSVNVDVALGNIRVKCYDDLAGAPNNLLAESGSIAVTGTGFQDFALTVASVVPSDGIVWIGFEVDNASFSINRDSTTSQDFIAHAYGAGPNPFGVSSTQTLGFNMRLLNTLGNIASAAIDGNTTTFWQSDAGINESITLDMGSVVNMYGLAYFLSTDAGMTETQFQIKAFASDNIVATGGTITQDGDFKVHTFLSNDTFEITSGSGSVDRLVIAGGGGGGFSFGGGGGAGGYVEDTVNMSTGTFPAVIGSGGVGGIDATTFPANGVDSTFDTITAVGGGAGGSQTSPAGGAEEAGQNGGSGGGGNQSNSDTGGTGVAGQGFAGGNGDGGNATGGGGGGAGAVGFAGSTTGGNGGAGLQSNIDGLNLFRAGGGGGGVIGALTAGVGGQGGGGAGGNSGVAGTNGTVNTGSGGGGSGVSATPGGTGGSGIIIIRYFSPAVTPPPVQILRTINLSDMTLDAWNFIRFNGVNTQFLTIEGSSGGTLVMAANELAVQLETDPPLTTKHGQFEINGTNENLPFNGGDPTSSVIDDPSVNSLTLVGTVTQNDPVPGASVIWTEPIDGSNDGIFTKVKQGGIFAKLQVNTKVSTKGDLFTFSDQNDRLGVGTDGQRLEADSAELTGMKWVTPPVVSSDTIESADTLTNVVTANGSITSTLSNVVIQTISGTTIVSDLDLNIQDHFQDWGELAVPANPGLTVARMYQYVQDVNNSPMAVKMKVNNAIQIVRFF